MAVQGNAGLATRRSRVSIRTVPSLLQVRQRSDPTAGACGVRTPEAPPLSRRMLPIYKSMLYKRTYLQARREERVATRASGGQSRRAHISRTQRRPSQQDTPSSRRIVTCGPKRQCSMRQKRQLKRATKHGCRRIRCNPAKHHRVVTAAPAARSPSHGHGRVGFTCTSSGVSSAYVRMSRDRPCGPAGIDKTP